MSVRAHKRSFTVRTQLTAIVVSVTAVMIAAGALIAQRDYRRSRDDAGADASFQAKVAADAIDGAFADVTSGIAQTASGLTASGAFPALQATPSACSLAGSGSGALPKVDVHIFDAAGVILCSSARKDAYAARARLSVPALGAIPAVAGPTDDPLTRDRAVMAFAAIRSPDAKTILGGVAGAISVAPITAELQRLYGGLSRTSFEIVDARAGTLVSSSTGRSKTWTAEATTGPGPDGVTRIYRAARAPALGWTVYAGIDERLAIAGARSRLGEQLVLILAALGIMLALGFFVYRKMARPIRSLTEAVAQAERDVMPEAVSVTGPTEIVHLVQTFNRMIATRSEQERKLEHQTFHDELTGLPNRTVLTDRLRNALAKTSRGNERIAVLVVDIDRFRVVNEGVGRVAADRMLVEVSRRIGTVLRGGDTLARFSGDEFVILCEDLASHAEAGVVAERIARCLKAPVEAGGAEATLTVSTGIALGRMGDDADQLLRDADGAMTQAKERGKNRYEFSDSGLRHTTQERLQIENDLRKAIERGELVLHYQPEMEIRTGRTVAAEALLRWRHPEKGVIQPLTFIPVAEETGLIVAIGRFVIEEACRQVARWRREGHELRVSVNLSPRQLHDRDLPSIVEYAIAHNGISPSLLCLEVTESTLMRGPEVGAMLEALKGLGISISIDDFGTGYSSLAYLQRFPVDQVKIDRSFVAALGTDDGTGPVVRAVIDLARALDLDIVAEGVEEPEQLAMLRTLGCDIAQGYLIMRPETAEHVSAFLTRTGATTPA